MNKVKHKLSSRGYSFNIFIYSFIIFSLWSTAHVKIMLCPGFMTNLYVTNLTKNLAFEKNSFWILTKVSRLQQVSQPRFGMLAPTVHV